MTTLLIVCTANQCRSPMAAGLLAREVVLRGAQATIRSAGFLEGGIASPDEVVLAATSLGIDLSGHRSRQLGPQLLEDSDAVVTMTRRHVRELVVNHEGLWGRTFTLRELVRRGQEHGARAPEEALGHWLDALHRDRSATALLGADPSDDVADPMGLDQEQYDEMAAELADLTTRLADLVWPVL